MRINIIYQFQEGPWGGGNQFLKALRNKFEQKGVYERNPNKANCFLINSHHNFELVLPIKKKNQDNIFIHRIDGPLVLTRKGELNKDYKIFELNQYVADGTIFQSMYSKIKNLDLGLIETKFTKIIQNATDDQIFYPQKNKKLIDFQKQKCQLVTTSWSKSSLKGFELYKYLDENLDFERYSMILVGRSPIKFKNIKHLGLVGSKELANLLRESDIYISGARKEACSNSLIEALSCGLPCVVVKSGSNPEIIKNGGELFKKNIECVNKINLVKSNYQYYRNNISANYIDDICKQYTKFFGDILSLKETNKYKTKRLRTYEYYKILLSYSIFKITILKVLFRELLSIIINIKNNFSKLI